MPFRLPSFLFVLVASALPALAQPVVNRSGAAVELLAGPRSQQRVVGRFDPGELMEAAECALGGRWCRVSDNRNAGWVDMTRLSPGAVTRDVPVRTGLGRGPRVDGPGRRRGIVERMLDFEERDRIARERDFGQDDVIEVTPLPSVGATAPLPDAAARPLPDAIISAVPGARLQEVPGAAPPLLLSTSEPIRNVTTGLVNLRSGPTVDAAVTGQLQPGEGGVIDVCTPAEDWCRITVPGGGRAWVKTTLVGLRRL